MMKHTTSVRLTVVQHKAAERAASRLAQSLGKRVNTSDVIRIALDDYLRRSGDYPTTETIMDGFIVRDDG